jgi:hypothetical protein
MNIRVQLLEKWDRMPFDVSPDMTVAALKRDALTAFGLTKAEPADYVVKLRGWEVLGEQGTIADSGAREGSTYLVAYRRRRAVR